MYRSGLKSPSGNPYTFGNAGYASFLFAVLVSGTAAAQPVEGGGVATSVEPGGGPGEPQAIGHGAMPGGIHVPDAETLPKAPSK
jgi:hypothetical protein